MSAEKDNFNNYNNYNNSYQQQQQQQHQNPIQTITTAPYPSSSTSGFYPVQTLPSSLGNQNQHQQPPPSYIQTQNVYQTYQVPVIVPFGLFHKSPQHLVKLNGFKLNLN